MLSACRNRDCGSPSPPFPPFPVCGPLPTKYPPRNGKALHKCKKSIGNESMALRAQICRETCRAGRATKNLGVRRILSIRGCIFQGVRCIVFDGLPGAGFKIFRLPLSVPAVFRSSVHGRAVVGSAGCDPTNPRAVCFVLCEFRIIVPFRRAFWRQ